MHFSISYVRILRLLLGSIACLLYIGFLFPLAADGGGLTVAPPPQLTPASSPGARRHIARIDMELLYASKRRVPNGADPIHNRRAGQSGQPPGRA